MDDAAALRRVHAFFDAADQRDAKAFKAMLAQGFILFEDGRAVQGDALSKGWVRSHKNAERPRMRSCNKERIRRSNNAVVYMGDCSEHIPAHGKRPASDWQGWNTVVLVHGARTWKVVLWQWQKSGLAAERNRWNEAYRAGTGFTKKPNKLLIASVAGVAPGGALVLAMGQGRNALYLASRGWRVTGVDISNEGIRIAEQQAAERGISINAILADIDKYDVGKDRWDLVTMLYAGNDVGWIERIRTGIKPGGLFVVEYFHKDDGAAADADGFKTGELAKLFSGWYIIRDEVVSDVADWTFRKTKLVRFVAKKRSLADRRRPPPLAR